MLTPKRTEILDFIASFIKERGYPPSVRDVVRGCGLSSTSVAQYHLEVLERQGFIRRTRDVSRGIALAPRADDISSIPVLGTIAAGNPIPVPSAETWSTVPQEIVKLPEYLLGRRRNVYALRVKGTSMIDSLIDDGDIVIMEAATTADNGDAVAVWLRDRQEVTLKRICHEPDRVCLKPASSLMNPMYFRPEDVEIQGKVIAVIRKLAR